MNRFQTLFQLIKNSEDSGFIKDIKFSKGGEEYIILHSKNGNQDYDINIMVWFKAFTTCGIFQVSGRIRNEHFRVYFIIDNNGKIELFDFSKKAELCEILYDKNHRFIQIRDDNLETRKKIYRDTKQLRNKFNKFIKNFE
jgi:hypothetical protein